MVHRTIWAFFIWLCLLGQASALTVQWDCNPESDVKEYRVEYSANAGNSWGIEATVPHPRPCTSPVTLGITRYLSPGQKLFRVFASDRAGNISTLPSQPASYTVKPPLIGSTGGQVEESIPPSPYTPVVQPVPPAPIPTPPAPVPPSPPGPVPVPVPPAPPPIPAPGAISNWSVKATGTTSLEVNATAPDDGTGKLAEIDVRILAGTAMYWGSAPGVLCRAFPCAITGLPAGSTYTVQAIPFRRITDSPSVFGPFVESVTVTLYKPTPPPPPPVEPVPVPPAPPSPPAITMKEALQSGLDTCLKNKLAHTACMKALSEAVGKVQP